MVWENMVLVPVTRDVSKCGCSGMVGWMGKVEAMDMTECIREACGKT